MRQQPATRTLLITGAAGALGSALAEEGLRRGHRVIMLDCNRRGLESFFDRAVEAGLPEPVLHPLDLASAGPQDFETLLGAIEGEFGGLDAVVHCAARFEALTPVEHLAPPEWLQVLQVNLSAAWLLSAMSLPLLRASPSGRLVFLLDDLARVEGPLWGAYGVCKHALRVLALQFAGTCEAGTVGVYGVDPGPMRSPLRARAYLAEDPATLPAPGNAAARIMAIAEGSEKPQETLLMLDQPA